MAQHTEILLIKLEYVNPIFQKTKKHFEESQKLYLIDTMQPDDLT